MSLALEVGLTCFFPLDYLGHTWCSSTLLARVCYFCFYGVILNRVSRPSTLTASGFRLAALSGNSKSSLKSKLLRVTKNASMKYLITTIAAALLMGCGGSEEPIPRTDTKPTEPDTDVAKSEPPTAQGINYWRKYTFFFQR